jgi:hypothetical protein
MLRTKKKNNIWHGAFKIMQVEIELTRQIYSGPELNGKKMARH